MASRTELHQTLEDLTTLYERRIINESELKEYFSRALELYFKGKSINKSL